MALKHAFHSAAGILTGHWRRSLKLRASSPDEVPALKTGFSQLDRAIGVGGLPQGRITELIGPNTGGALSVAAKIAAKFQRKQLPVTILDIAGHFELAHVVRCGLVAPELFSYRPQTAFELISLAEEAARQPGLLLLNFGFIPETLGSASAPSLKALLQRLRRIVITSESAFLCLTHPEDMNPFIHTNYLPAFPLNEVADVRLWVQDEGWIGKGEQIGGYRGNITVIKNNLAASGKGANIRIPFVDPEMVRLSDELGF
jgi:recombination protein RecA